MFVYSLKGSTLKFLAVIVVCAGILAVLVNVIPTAQEVSAKQTEVKLNYAGIKTDEDRIAFLAQFGWKALPEAVEVAEVAIPAEFDAVLEKYNTVQKQQGLNLEKYRKKTLKRYTYKLSEYSGYEGVTYANLLVYKDRVVAGDICTADINGFMHGFDKYNKPVN